MNKPDFQLYKLDLTATSVFNKVTLEEGKRESKREDVNYMFIPLQAPFYIDSVEMYRHDGSKMVFEEDYDFYGILSGVTAYTTKPVGLYIRILKKEIKSWKVTYQVVGNFNKITNEILDMLRVLQDDDRLIDWDNIDNKPLWFVPELHQHDWTYDIFEFTDLARELLRVGELAKQTSGRNIQNRIDSFLQRIDAYIDLYKSNLMALINSHDGSKVDNHGVNKTHIGLGLVDNFATATLEETLEGLRRDLHIVPFSAAKAAELAAGRNERLLPSGSLPILRYGSDSFIPPKIDGSFEGMGGVILRPGACVEPNGELLVLQRRYNGRVKGLYFLRCNRWDTTRPIWEFTGYRYTHPQATADGANLSAILAGSNQYIMVIGDEDKNIWYWVETNGTFNPASHVLNRITDATLLSYFTQRRHNRAQICSDENYKELNLIAVALTSSEVAAIRPSYPAQGPGARMNDGWRLFVNSNMDGRYIGSRIDFQSNSPGTPNYWDGAFVPYQTAYSNGLVTSFEFKPTKPVQQLWRYHAPAAYIKKNGEQWAFSVQYRMWWSMSDGNSNSCDCIWRGNIQVTNDVQPTLHITNGPNEKLYTVNPSSIEDSPEGKLFSKYKVDWRWACYADASGTVVLNGYRLIITTSNLLTIPLSISLDKDTQYFDGGELSGVLPKSGESRIYSFNFGEMNPIGLSAGFQNQFISVANTEDWNSGIIMARQVVTDSEEIKIKGPSKWMAREVNILGSDWNGRWDNVQTTSFGGQPVTHYPLSNKGYEVDLGISVVMSTSAQGFATPNRKTTWNSIFGCDAFSWLLGKAPEGSSATTPGDGLLADKTSCSLVGNVVTPKAEVVFNVRKAIARDIQPLVRALRHPNADILNSWTFVRMWGENNDPFYWLVCSYPVNEGAETDNLYATVAPVKVTGVGAKTVRNGYDYYDDVKITFLKPFIAPLFVMSSVLRGVPPMGMHGNSEAHSALTMCWNTWPNATPLQCSLRTLHRWSVVGNVQMVDLIIDATFQGEIKRIQQLPQPSVGPENEWVITTGAGYGNVSDNAGLMEGAGTISYGLSSSGNAYDNVVNKQLDTTKRFLGMSNILISTFTIYFKEIRNVILAGKSYDIPSTFVDIRDIDPNPANKKYYVYLKYAGTGPKYEVTTQVQPETPVCSMLAEVQCGPTQITSVIPYNRFSMDGAIISTKRQGSAIRAATGGSFETGYVGGWFNTTDFVPE